MRKGAGISGLTRHSATSTSFNTLSSTISSNQIETLSTSLSSFREELIRFASMHREDIRSDPAFRFQFQKMCSALGVDPLAGAGSPSMYTSTSRGGKGAAGGWWSELVGLGEWEYGLAVQIVDVCVSSRDENGGIIEIGDLIRRVERLRRGPISQKEKEKGISPKALAVLGTSTTNGTAQEDKNAITVTPDDILRALELLRPLKAGYTIHHSLNPSPSTSSFSSYSLRLNSKTAIGMGQGHGQGQTYIRTIPRELNTDQSTLLALAATTNGLVSVAIVRRLTGWNELRIKTALRDCVLVEGMGWVDYQSNTTTGNGNGNGAGGDDFQVVWLIAAVKFEI